MASEDAPRDNNFVPAALFEIDGSSREFMPGQIDQATGRILTTAAGGSGTVTSVSVTSANGFAGTVATATTTPAITISTTINSPLLAGNGTAISAATTTGSGSTAVLNNSPTFVDDITIGTAATASGSILFKGLTSGTVTLSVADAAGTWTMKLPTTDGGVGEFLQTDGSGNTTWAAVSASAGGSDTQLQYNNAGALGGISGATTNGTSVTITSGNLTATAPKFITNISDTNGNELFVLTATASAVNEFTVANGATGNNPKFTASGGDTDVGFDFQAKGAGVYRFLGNATQAAELRLYEDTDDGTNYTAFKVGTQAASLTYTLPTAYPGVTGYVLSSTDAGVMSWVAQSSGANTALSNLASVQINTNLVFQDDATPTDRLITIDAQAAANTDGNALLLSAGAGNGTGYGGNIDVTAGQGGATQEGGTATLKGGAGGATSGKGGNATVIGGAATAGNTNGGSVRLLPGVKAGSGANGTVDIVDPTSGFDATFVTSSLAATRTYTFQDASGSLTLNANPANFTPSTNDGFSLGTAALQWSDLFLAEGGVINWDNGDVTITQTNNVLAIAGTTSVTFNAAATPSANDGGALGAAGTAWSDLFLAEGGVINWDSSDLTLTQTGNELALAGGNLDIGTNTLRIAGDIDIDGTPASDDTWTGPSTNSFNAGATIAQWEAVYLDTSSTWQLTDADAATTAGSVMIALATAAGSAASALRVLLPGSFARNDAWNWTVGGPIYLSATPGALTQTQPSGTDDVIRVCGWAVNADTIFWNPSPDWITHV